VYRKTDTFSVQKDKHSEQIYLIEKIAHTSILCKEDLLYAIWDKVQTLVVQDAPGQNTSNQQQVYTVSP